MRIFTRLRWRLSGVLALLAIVVGIFVACGENRSSRASDAAERADNSGMLGGPVDDGDGVLKPIQWGPVRTAKRSVMIGALVGYCNNGSPRPYIERVKRSQRMDRIVLTMFVRFPPRRTGPNAPGCSYLGIGVEKWITFRKNLGQFKFFDGATSPPTPRSVN